MYFDKFFLKATQEFQILHIYHVDLIAGIYTENTNGGKEWIRNG